MSRRRLLLMTVTIAVLAALGAAAWFTSRTATTLSSGGLNWYPGYYVVNHIDTAAAKARILADPLVEPFMGVQFRYPWAASERAPGDYSAGFAALDADLRRVDAAGKKLMVMLTYKTFDGTPSVPRDLRSGPGPWCSGTYCGEFAPDAATRLALLWNPVVNTRLGAWITAMARHLTASPYADAVAGIVLNETAVGTTSPDVLASAGYDPYVYLRALQQDLLAATTAAPHLLAIVYFEGGFVSMDGRDVEAGRRMGDWIVAHPRVGVGTPDTKPNDPKTTNHPCANARYQPAIVCAPAVQANDYSISVTDSFEETFRYATDPSPDGLHGSFLTFSYAVGDGPNAFDFADVSRSIETHPIPNTSRPVVA